MPVAINRLSCLTSRWHRPATASILEQGLLEPFPVPNPPTQGTRVKAALATRYRIERELGHGGMATVYLAEDLKHRREVAVKVLRPDLATALGLHREYRLPDADGRVARQS